MIYIVFDKYYTCILCMSVESTYLKSNLIQIVFMRVMQVEVFQKNKTDR